MVCSIDFESVSPKKRDPILSKLHKPGSGN